MFKFNWIFVDLLLFFRHVFVSLSFGKGMRSQKVDSVKIVLTLEREHENQGLRGCETCSKTIQFDVQVYAKSRMQFGSHFDRNFDRFLGVFWGIFKGILVSKNRVGKNIEKRRFDERPRRASRRPARRFLVDKYW